MAIVPDLSTGAAPDRALASPNRRIAGSPLGSTVPLYSGEIIQNTSTGDLWFATATTSTSWTLLTLAV
jgi:hypothetical protein